MLIHIVIPHFRCLRWLVPCVTLLRRHANKTHTIIIDVMNTDLDPEQRAEAAHAVAGMAACHDMPIKGIGGQMLPSVLLAGVRLCPDADITVTVDPDALTLRPNWDVWIVNWIRDIGYTAVGINPRCHMPEFTNCPEWNWMAFDTNHWRDNIGEFRWNRHDIGQRFADAPGARVLTLPTLFHWKEGKPAAVCAEHGQAEPFAFHAFYSSRRVQDMMQPEEPPAMLTEQEEKDVITWALSR